MMSYKKLREYRDDPNYREYNDEDEDSSINGLTEQIGSNIFQINSGANSLERALKNIGTDRDSLQLRDSIHETSQSTNEIVQTTTRLLRSVANKRLNKQQKVQFDLLKSHFQDAIQRFQTLQKRAADKVKEIKLKVYKVQQPLISFDGDNDQRKVLQEQQQQQTLALKEQAKVIEDDLAVIQEREKLIRQLESDILNVNEIFRDLGSLVQAQGEVLDTIDSIVERASGNVELGNQELMKAAVYQRKSRKKLCCLIIIFLIIIIIITIIVLIAVYA